jgi:DNA-binding CsgD family transcriptional regulator
MSLTLSSHEIALLGNALAITAAPLAYARTREWCAAVRLAIEPLIGAAKSASGMPFADDPFMESPADDVDAWDLYVKTGFADERGDRRIGRRGPEVADMPMVHDVPGLLRSELYNEFALPYRMFQPVSIQLFVGARAAPAAITFFRDSPHSRPFGQRGVAILDLVRPVFRASVELILGLERTRLSGAFAQLVDELPDAVALCSESGHLLHESPSLARLLSAEPLAASVRSAVRRVARALAGVAAEGAPKSAPSSLGVPSAVEVNGARSRYAVRGSLLNTATTSGAEAATIVFVSPASPRMYSDTELADRFALTAREIQALRLLAVGRSAREVAATLGISYYTARHHVEHVLAKLGVHTRAAVAAAITH